jgi:hypothetical protein
VLCCSQEAARSRYQHRSLSRADVEALAVEVYPWRLHWHREDAYWVVGRPAAAILGVTSARLRQLGDEDRVPYVVHRDGTRLYRREQLEVVAQARDAMRH